MHFAVSHNDSPPPAGAYSPAVRYGNLLFVSGQGPFRKDGSVGSRDFRDQVRQTMRNIERLAHEAGTSLAHTVRIGGYLASLNSFEDYNFVLKEFLTDPLPARTTIEVSLRGFDVEIDAIIAIP
jgi:2-iminobutanoate/2-iminopropanoate deaminase